MSKFAKNRYSKKRINEPYAPKVTKVELSEKHFWKRLIVALVLLVCGAGGIAYAISGLLTKSSGWQEISASSKDDISCSSEFVLNYNLGASGVSAGPENRAVAAVYSEACVYAYEAFDSFNEAEGVGNLASLNNNPNEIITVEPCLYEALELLEGEGSRHIYLAPLYRMVDDAASCDNDTTASLFDPSQNADAKQFSDTVVAFANDPQSIDIELLGNNQVMLKISDEYLSFADDHGIDSFVDLYYMLNAFRCDYIADKLVEAGHLNGVLASYDGFTRYLDAGTDTQSEYNLNIFDREDNVIRDVALMSYSGTNACAVLKDFPLVKIDEYSYYAFEDGHLIAPMISVKSGSCDMKQHWIAGFSNEFGCAQLLVNMMGAVVENDSSIESLASKGISTVYAKDRQIYCDLKTAVVSGLYNKDGVEYKVK